MFSSATQHCDERSQTSSAQVDNNVRQLYKVVSNANGNSTINTKNKAGEAFLDGKKLSENEHSSISIQKLLESAIF